MKINLENMKEIANKLDRHNSTLEGIDVDDVCSMAYQLQYFFEAMEKIEELVNIKGIYPKQTFLDILNNALINKEE